MEREKYVKSDKDLKEKRLKLKILDYQMDLGNFK